MPAPGHIQLSLVAFLSIPKPFTVDLKPFNLTLFRRSTVPMTPYIELPLPEQHLKGNSTIAVTGQTVQIANVTEFTGLIHDALFSDKFTLSVRGTADAFLGPLKTRITLDKDVQLQGLNKLEGFKIDSAQALLPPQGQNNLAGNISLPNPSIVTIELVRTTCRIFRCVLTISQGDLTLNLNINDTSVGQAFVQGLRLAPGSNSFPFTGTLDFQSILQNIAPILTNELPSLLNQSLSLSATGSSVSLNGSHIPYYEDNLKSIDLPAQLAIAPFLKNTISAFLSKSSQNPLSSLQQGFVDLLNKFESILPSPGSTSTLSPSALQQDFNNLLSKFTSMLPNPASTPGSTGPANGFQQGITNFFNGLMSVFPF